MQFDGIIYTSFIIVSIFNISFRVVDVLNLKVKIIELDWLKHMVRRLLAAEFVELI